MMKWWHWALIIFVLYEGVAGVFEILSSNDIINTNFANVPTVGSLYPSYAGAIDVATAGLVYFFVLHDTVKELL